MRTRTGSTGLQGTSLSLEEVLFSKNLVQVVSPLSGLQDRTSSCQTESGFISLNTQHMFEGKVTWVSPIYKSKKEGFFRIVKIALFGEDSDSGKAFLNPGYKNYSRWKPLLREGVVIKNLLWADESLGLIDGDSPVEEV